MLRYETVSQKFTFQVYSPPLSLYCGTKTLWMSLNDRHYEWDKIASNGNASANTSTVPAVDEDDDQYTDEMNDGGRACRSSA